jgi:DNA-binding CsgD family transcriptional regulator
LEQSAELLASVLEDRTRIQRSPSALPRPAAGTSRQTTDSIGARWATAATSGPRPNPAHGRPSRHRAADGPRARAASRQDQRQIAGHGGRPRHRRPLERHLAGVAPWNATLRTNRACARPRAEAIAPRSCPSRRPVPRPPPRNGEPFSGAHLWHSLSQREREVARLYANGNSHKELARLAGIAPATARAHLAAVYRKLGVNTKVALLRRIEGLDAELVPTASLAGTNQQEIE